jgi:hypothetical protein
MKRHGRLVEVVAQGANRYSLFTILMSVSVFKNSVDLKNVDFDFFIVFQMNNTIFFVNSTNFLKNRQQSNPSNFIIFDQFLNPDQYPAHMVGHLWPPPLKTLIGWFVSSLKTLFSCEMFVYLSFSSLDNKNFGKTVILF